MEINAETTAVQRCEVQTIEASGMYPRIVLHFECDLCAALPVGHVNVQELKLHVESAVQDAVFLDAGEVGPDTAPSM